MTPAFRLNENTGEYEATKPLVQSDILDQAKTILSEKLMRSSEPLSNPSDTKDFQQGSGFHIFITNNMKI